MCHDPNCPLCGKATEYVYKIDQVPCVIKEMKEETMLMIKVLDKKIDAVAEGVNKRVDRQEKLVDKLLFMSLTVLISIILGGVTILLPYLLR